MIGSLRGRLIERSTKGDVLVEVGGVGYRVTVAPSTFAKLGGLDAETFVYTYTHVRVTPSSCLDSPRVKSESASKYC